MILKLIAILFLLFTISVSEAQKIEWKENDLKWEDFQGIPNTNTLIQSELSYYIGYKSDKSEINDTIVSHYKSYCYVDGNASCVIQFVNRFIINAAFFIIFLSQNITILMDGLNCFVK